MTSIKVNNVWKEYGSQVVLEQINFTTEPHAFLMLVGPSGCGKSTFLKILLSQEKATRGVVTIGEHDLPDSPDASRGVVFQKYSVFPHLTVLENVLVGLEFAGSPVSGRLSGKNKRAARELSLHYLEAVGLGASIKKYPHQLSGGMQQRLAVAQAIVKKPEVLLLDEPFGALDPGIRHEIQDVMLELWAHEKMTIVMVTHDLQEAFYLGTRVMVFDRERNREEEKERYGATIVLDLEVNGDDLKSQLLQAEKILNLDHERMRF